MADSGRWFVIDRDGRVMKGQPRDGFGDYGLAYDFAEQHYAGSWRIELR